MSAQKQVFQAIGYVQEIGQTQAGKPKVKIAGHWYFLGRISVLPIQGQNVKVSYSTFGDRNNLRGVESWEPATSPDIGAVPAAASPMSPQASSSAAVPYIDEAQMRFISNVVGNAIAAGALKDPNQVTTWFRAAKKALASTDAVPFDDDLDSRNTGYSLQDATDAYGER